MFKLDKYKEIKDLQEFIDSGFSIINSNGDKHRFKTVWKCACITIIKIGSLKNEVVCDRQREFDKYPMYYISALFMIIRTNCLTVEIWFLKL